MGYVGLRVLFRVRGLKAFKGRGYIGDYMEVVYIETIKGDKTNCNSITCV